MLVLGLYVGSGGWTALSEFPLPGPTAASGDTSVICRGLSLASAEECWAMIHDSRLSTLYPWLWLVGPDGLTFVLAIGFGLAGAGAESLRRLAQQRKPGLTAGTVLRLGLQGVVLALMLRFLLLIRPIAIVSGTPALAATSFLCGVFSKPAFTAIKSAAHQVLGLIAPKKGQST